MGTAAPVEVAGATKQAPTATTSTNAADTRMVLDGFGSIVHLLAVESRDLERGLARVPLARGQLTAPRRLGDPQHLAAACRQIVHSHKPDDALGVYDEGCAQWVSLLPCVGPHALASSGLMGARPGTPACAVPGAACATPGG